LADPFTVVIPARYGSTRLPAKALADIAGRPMILRVCDQALRSGAAGVIVATDDERIADVLQDCGAQVMMTSPTHRSGTDRVAEVVAALGADDDAVFVNVQGDEPLMPPAAIGQVAALITDAPGVDMATLCTPMVEVEHARDPAVVKVVSDADGNALYFSRAPIPWHRERFEAGQGPDSMFRHLGIYAYRAGFLRRFTELPVSPLEVRESLEQLRVLYHGHKIRVEVAVEVPPPGVDTQADLERVRAMF